MPCPKLLLQQLSRAHLPAMHAHLLRLDDIDRVQRFAQPASDAVIEGYLTRLDFNRDAHYGMWTTSDCTSKLVGLTHLAIDSQGCFAEIGVSVDRDYRRQGLASRMLERAILHARNAGVDEVVMYFLPYNTELIELARRLGMRISVGNGEGIARLLPGLPSLVSLANELLATWGEVAAASLNDWSGGTVSASRSVCGALQDAVQRHVKP